MELIHAGVNYESRETVESALLMGAEGLRHLGWDEAIVAEALDDVCRRDAQPLPEQVQGNTMSGQDKIVTVPIPEPVATTKPISKGDTL